MSSKKYIESPIGMLEIVAEDDFVIEINFVGCQKEENTSQVLEECANQLKEYFNGKRKEFHVPVRQQGTEFRKGVWDALLKISFGETACYKDIAVLIGNEKAVRAVGLANKNNKIPIIIPCHRIIGKDGSLTGYAGELWRKEWLLNHEKNF